MINAKTAKIAFFGGEPLSVPTLEELKVAGIMPDLIVCNPDRRSGRKMTLTPPPTKIWAEANNIEVLQPENYKDESIKQKLTTENFDLFIVVAYGKILPKWLIDLPKHKTINVHPSLLPKFRGPSPIRSAILDDTRETGVTIMQMDEEMDHGPIITQMKMEISPANWPIDGNELDLGLARMGGALLASIIPDWLAGKITPTPQNHNEATFCKKITKEMGELNLNPHDLPTGNEAYQNLLKIRAFAGWPETFFIHENKRYKIKSAELDENGQLKILRVVPEGKNEVDFSSCFNT